MASNARKHTVPAPTDTSISRETIFQTFGNSIRDVVPVANTTERSLLVSELTSAGQAPSPTKPLVVLRADARGLHRIEWTADGTVWVPSTGVIEFTSKSAADSWAVSNGSYLSIGDRAQIGGIDYRWSGTAWVTRMTKGFRVSAATNANGIVSVANPFTDVIPTWVQVTMQSTGNEALAKILSPIVWTAPLEAGNVQIRFRRTDTNDWAATQPVAFFITFGLD